MDSSRVRATKLLRPAVAGVSWATPVRTNTSTATRGVFSRRQTIRMPPGSVALTTGDGVAGGGGLLRAGGRGHDSQKQGREERPEKALGHKELLGDAAYRREAVTGLVRGSSVTSV